MKSITIVFVVAIVALVATTASVLDIQTVTAIAFPGCSRCAKDFLSGQEKKI
jgi:hypothetical protein